MREALKDMNEAESRYNELKTWEEFDVMKGFIDGICD